MPRSLNKNKNKRQNKTKSKKTSDSNHLYCSNKKYRNMKKSKAGVKFSFKCKRKSDGKVFEMPRLYSYNECKKDMSGFTKRSSCAPFNIKK